MFRKNIHVQTAKLNYEILLKFLVRLVLTFVDHAHASMNSFRRIIMFDRLNSRSVVASAIMLKLTSGYRIFDSQCHPHIFNLES